MVQQGADTQRRLVETAISLFSSRWYASVSVAEICREAGLSNGVFYRYFPNKESIFLHILEDVIERIAAALDRTGGETIEARIKSMTEILVGFSAEHPDLITVFREGQYRYFEYERRLTETYRRIPIQDARAAGGHSRVPRRDRRAPLRRRAIGAAGHADIHLRPG
ncbi:MAG: TetR/AcrR family transcriptional regulator [Spirochaetaceae bacterium]|nr:TetR/AcrR family transcriptional regulator [Spirochaetaceae bacterium]